MSTILVCAEQAQGTFRKAALEAVAQAKVIAGGLGAEVAAVVAGPVDNPASLSAYGADKVLSVANADLENYNSDTYKAVVLAAVESTGADVVVFSATTSGKDLSPRVAIALDAAIASDVTGLTVDGGIKLEKQLYAGKAFATVELAAGKNVVSLRPGAFDAKIVAEGAEAAVEELAVELPASKVTVKEMKLSGGDKLDVSDADIIVTGGRGLKSAENFNIIEELAETLGAAVGATRAVVDAEWRPHGEQVGQTGKVVSPNLYIMAGASGSIQHWAGMASSKIIVAVNKDAEAPIMKRADYGIVGDLFEVIPAITAELKK